MEKPAGSFSRFYVGVPVGNRLDASCALPCVLRGLCPPAEPAPWESWADYYAANF